MIFLTSLVSLRMSWPAMRAVPEVGGMMPVSMEIDWVLPAPLGPRRPNTSPSSTAKLIPLTASKSPYFLTS